MMERLRRAGAWRDCLMVAAILALFVQMGVAVAHGPRFGAVDPPLDAPLCHAVTGADNGTAPPPGKIELCPVCLALAAGGVAVLPPPAAESVVLAEVVLPRLPLPDGTVPGAHGPGSSAQPRAPPIA